MALAHKHYDTDAWATHSRHALWHYGLSKKPATTQVSAALKQLPHGTHLVLVISHRNKSTRDCRVTATVLRHRGPGRSTTGISQRFISQTLHWDTAALPTSLSISRRVGHRCTINPSARGGERRWRHPPLSQARRRPKHHAHKDRSY